MHRIPHRKQPAEDKPASQMQAFAAQLSVPMVDFCKEGDFLKVNVGDTLGLARVTKAELTCPALKLIQLGQPAEHEGQMCWWVIEFVKCDADRNPLGIVRRDWLSVQSEGEARAIFEKERERMFARHEEMLRQFKLLSAMPAAEQAIQMAQWEVLKEVWPMTVEAILDKTDPSKDYNAETIARTGKPVLAIEAGDTVTFAKLDKARRRKLMYDRVNVEIVTGWKDGYEDMKPEEYTAKINAKLGTDITVSAMKSRAITKLGLTSRRREGRPANDGELPPG